MKASTAMALAYCASVMFSMLLSVAAILEEDWTNILFAGVWLVTAAVCRAGYKQAREQEP